MNELAFKPAWICAIEAAYQASLSAHLQAEFDLRAVFRSAGSPADALERAGVVLRESRAVLERHLALARALFLINSAPFVAETRRRLGEQIALMYLLLLSRAAGDTTCRRLLTTLAETGDGPGTLRLAHELLGLLPYAVDFEGAVADVLPAAAPAEVQA